MRMAIIITRATRTITMSELNSLLNVLQYASPSLPVGGFAYSQGLEFAVEAGWVRDFAGARAWILGTMVTSLARLDLPIFLRLHRAAFSGRASRFEYWENFIIASRETREQRAEELDTGSSFARIARALGADTRLNASRTLVGAFAAVMAARGVSEETALAAYAWSWAEHRVGAAVKLVPLGQTDGRRILAGCAGAIPLAVEHARGVRTRAIGCSLPGLALASALHESQYTRLFLT